MPSEATARSSSPACAALKKPALMRAEIDIHVTGCQRRDRVLGAAEIALVAWRYARPRDSPWRRRCKRAPSPATGRVPTNTLSVFCARAGSAKRSSQRASQDQTLDHVAPPPARRPLDSRQAHSRQRGTSGGAAITSLRRRRAIPASPRRIPSPWRRSLRFRAGCARARRHFSNSRSSSCWRFERLTGVSTTTSTYMSPREGERSTDMPLPRRRNWWPDWVPGGDGELGAAAVDHRHLDRAAQGRRRHRDRHAAMDVGAVALEDAVRLHREEDIEIARRAAAHAGLAFAGQPDAGSVLDARPGSTRRATSPCACGPGRRSSGMDSR